LENAKLKLQEVSDELAATKQKLQAVTARKDICEGQLKDIKGTF
jgi:hypothetical protein